LDVAGTLVSFSVIPANFVFEFLLVKGFFMILMEYVYDTKITKSSSIAYQNVQFNPRLNSDNTVDK
jgi:hypothetical protein